MKQKEIQIFHNDIILEYTLTQKLTVVTIRTTEPFKGVAKVQKTIWLALSYNLPANPSKMRVYVWRKLKEFGAEYFKQGMAILPITPHSMQQFAALAQKIRQMGGEASIVELRFTDPVDEAQMTARFKKHTEDEYTELLNDCKHALRELRNLPSAFSQKEGEQMKQVVKRYRKARSKDFFKTSTSREIEAGIDEMIDSVREIASDFSKQLRAMMDN